MLPFSAVTSKVMNAIFDGREKYYGYLTIINTMDASEFLLLFIHSINRESVKICFASI